MEVFKKTTELLTMMIGFLEPPLARYATISSQWQAIVEERTMAKMRLRDRELGVFAVVFESPRRRALLKAVHYSIELPESSRRRRDHATNCVVLEKAVMDLFGLLGAWEQMQEEEKQEEEKQEEKKQQEKKQEEKKSSLDVYLHVEWSENMAFTGKLADSRRFLTLPAADGPQTLPVLYSIAALSIGGRFGRALHPSAALAIATAAAPGLDCLDLELVDPANCRVDLRRQHRAALATGLLSALRSAQRPIRLSLSRKTLTEETQPRCHDYVPANLEQDGVDELCEALKLLGHEGKLAELGLDEVLVSKGLFRGSEGETWPALRRFSVWTGLVAADGQWWYTGDRDLVEEEWDSPSWSASDESLSVGSESGASTDGDAVANGEEPWYAWRTRPDPAAFDPFMKAAAEAVLRMPALEFGTIEVTYWDPIVREEEEERPIDIHVQWAGSGIDLEAPTGDWKRIKSPPEKLAARRCGVWVGGGTTWEVPESVMSLLKEWVGAGTVEVKVFP